MTEYNILDYGSPENITIAVKTVLGEIKEKGVEAKILFPKNNYHFYKEDSEERVLHTSNTDSKRFPEKRIGFLIEDIDNLTVDGDGSEFTYHGNMCALAAIRCKNITFRNFSWDYPCASTPEMKVIATGRDYADFSMLSSQEWTLKGNDILWYETARDGSHYWERKNCDRAFCTVMIDIEKKALERCNIIAESPFAINRISAKKLTDNTVRFKYFGKKPDALRENVVFGLCPNKDRDTAGAFFWESENITVEKIHPMYLHGFSWLVQMCKDITFRDCLFIPRENGERFITSFADSLHVAGAMGYVHVENCEFSHDLDDPINIHGSFMRVEKQFDPNTVKLIYCHEQQGGFKQFWPGNKVCFFSRDYLSDCEDGKLYTVKSVTDPMECGNDLMTSVVTFEEILPSYISDKIGSEGKYVAENVTFTPDVIIKGCKFSVVPTRGILCTTRGKVLIADNEFFGMAMASVYVSNDSDYWYESGPVRDMTICGNTFHIRKTMFKNNVSKGGIFVDPVTKGGKLPYYTDPIHKNITIDNNTFYMEHENVVYARSVDNLKITNNTIKLTDTKNDDKEIKAFRFDACKNVVISGNTYDAAIDMKPILENMPAEQVVSDVIE